MSLYLGSQTFSPCLWNTPGMFWSCPGKQELCQESTPKAVGSIPGINLSKWAIMYLCINSLLIKCPISSKLICTFMAIPCHVMQGKISRRADVAGFKFSIADRQILNDSNNPRSLKLNPSSSMFSGEVVGVVKVPAQRPLQWCYRFFQSDKSDCRKKGDLWGW